MNSFGAKNRRGSMKFSVDIVQTISDKIGIFQPFFL